MKIDAKKNWWTLIKYIPIFLLVTIMPLTVRLKQVVIKGIGVQWLPDPLVYGDLFNYYKARIIFFSALLALFLMVLGWVIGKIKFSWQKIDYFALGFLLVVMLSSSLSADKTTVWWGYSERWHGVATWMSYFVHFYYIKTLIKSKKDITYITRMVLLSALVMTLIGLLQVLSMDPFRMDLVKKLMLPAEYIKNNGLESMKFTFELNRVYMTLYNPNNVGVYVAAMIPFAVYGILNDKKIIKLTWGLTVLEALVCLMGSYSRAGLGALVLAFLLYILINLRGVIKYRKQIVVGVVLVFVVVIVGDGLANNVLSRRLFEMRTTRDAYTHLESITINENDLIIKYDGEDVNIKFYESKNIPTPFTDGGEELKVSQGEDGRIVFDKTSLSDLSYTLSSSQDVGYVVTLKFKNKYAMNFALVDGKVKYLNHYKKATDVVNAEYKGFENNLRWGSNRGYIWSRSIPLIFDKPLFGHGADQYVLVFPQTDYAAKINALGNPNMIVDKPHNQYLALLVDFGVVGTILFMSWIVLRALRGRKSILVVSVLSLLITFFFYDISVTTGWLLFVSLAILGSDAVDLSSEGGHND